MTQKSVTSRTEQDHNKTKSVNNGIGNDGQISYQTKADGSLICLCLCYTGRGGGARKKSKLEDHLKISLSNAIIGANS